MQHFSLEAIVLKTEERGVPKISVLLQKQLQRIFGVVAARAQLLPREAAGHS